MRDEDLDDEDLDEFDEESIVDTLIPLIENAKLGKLTHLNVLKKYLEELSSFFELTYGEDKEQEFAALIEDDEEFLNAISNIVNGDDFGWDRTDDLTESPQLLELIFRYLCPLYQDIEFILANNPNLPFNVAKELITNDYRLDNGEDGSAASIAAYAQDEKLLRLLAESSDSNARYRVAKNQLTPPDVLAKLADDTEQSSYPGIGVDVPGVPDWVSTHIKYAVIKNPSTPRATLEEMIAGEHLLPSEANSDDLNLALQNEARLALEPRI